ncbi:MAG: 2OG-Fe(II) oxygenase [Rubinisphaera brasiliensis]|uniref:2OG-Fe(II) oxygenase n=1 Tax=Rubinisphaera brasiliensis TaxID=119 RepID=UPI00391C3B67
MTTRDELAQTIFNRLEAGFAEIQASWLSSSPVQHVAIDNLLPDEAAAEISNAFPNSQSLMIRKSIREHKRIGVSVDEYEPIIRETLYAFQDPRVVEIVERITGISGMTPDPTLYASGISVMQQGDFLNPHLDNSHDGDQEKYRVLNLLYYLGPGWTFESGGNLEVWDSNVKQNTTVVSQFNRLVLMKTDSSSWHSVSKVVSNTNRLCVSNYYFSLTSPDAKSYRHVTTFTGRPGERGKRIVLKLVDGIALNTIGRLFPFLLKRSKHRIQDVGEAGEAQE